VFAVRTASTTADRQAMPAGSDRSGTAGRIHPGATSATPGTAGVVLQIPVLIRAQFSQAVFSRLVTQAYWNTHPNPSRPASRCSHPSASAPARRRYSERARARGLIGAVFEEDVKTASTQSGSREPPSPSARPAWRKRSEHSTRSGLWSQRHRQSPAYR
jgi:hypothetical protein